MGNARFVWLLGRNTARNGAILENGASYDVEAFGELIVAEWVITGAAAYAGEAPEKKTTKKPVKGEE